MSGTRKVSFATKTMAPNDAFSMMLGMTGQGEQITLIAVDQLTEYPNQPFKPYTEIKLKELADDIAENGILSPIRVRPHNGAYQILAGHNRRNAAILAGLDKVPCIVKDSDDDSAALIVVNTNLNQREELLPSEKAFAYKMQMEALNQQGKRTDLTSGTMCRKLNSAEKIKASAGESERNIRNYIRLTHLSSPLLKMVDEKFIPFRSGVNLSYLQNDEQCKLQDFMEENDIQCVSLKQSEALKALPALTDDTLKEIFGLTRQSANPAVKIGAATKGIIKKHFQGTSYDDKEISEIVNTALKAYFELVIR